MQLPSLDIEMTPIQMDFLKCEDRFSLFLGGIGSGKTYAGCVKDLCHAKKKTLGLVIAPTYGMLKDATIRTFESIAGDAIINFNKSELVMTIRGGGEIMFRSADNPNRLRGSSVNWAHIDEAGQCHPGTWDIVIGRLRADGQAGPVWITTTPNGRNWLYHRRESMTIFKAKTKDNPYLAPEFVRSLEQSYTGEFARQELDGEFISLEGLVYPQFGVHNVQQRPDADFTSWHLAMDEGYTNPAVILLIGIDNDGRLHIAREYYETGKLQEQVVAQAERWWSEKACLSCAVDAAAAGLIADLRNNNINARPHKGRVLDGIQKVQNLLPCAGDGRPRLTVDPGCVNTINEFESYAWREGKDEPIKLSDHSLDSIRYFVVGQPSGYETVGDPFANW